jgi:hypothetical protein
VLELAGPLAVAALVLAAGGLFKLGDPAPTRAMFVSLGVSSRRVAGVLAAVSAIVELAVGLVAFVFGGWLPAAATAVAFLAFALIAWRMTRLPSVTSCGCFGRLSSEPTLLHVAMNLAVAAGALTAMVGDAPGFLDVRRQIPAGGLVFGALALVGAWLVVVAMTILPETLAAARRGPAPATVRTFEITREP